MWNIWDSVYTLLRCYECGTGSVRIRILNWFGSPKRDIAHSNHLNTEHRIHLNTGPYGSPVFKWLNHMTWQTIQILDILDHKQAFSVWFSNFYLLCIQMVHYSDASIMATGIRIADRYSGYHLNTQPPFVWEHSVNQLKVGAIGIMTIQQMNYFPPLAYRNSSVIQISTVMD